MTDDQLQKITWELSLEDHDAFQPVEPSSKTAKNMSFRPVDPPCAAFNWFLFQAVGEQHRWGGRGDWDREKWDELIDWDRRRPAGKILADMAERTEDIPGIQLEFREQEQGPTSGKPIQIELSADDPAAIERAVEQLRAAMQRLGGFRDIEDNRSLPGVEWRLQVDREAAARFGADVTTIGSAVQLVTNGLQIATYRPQDATDEVDIRVRLPGARRSLDQLQRMTINTARGQVPISHFVTLEPAPKVGTLHRVDGQRTLTLEADVTPGRQVDERIQALSGELDSLPDGVRVGFAGEQQDQAETSRFLGMAFGIAIFLMAIILVTQFNSLYQAGLVLSAIVFSTAGVLLGLLLNAQPFGIVMVGMGIIALAGIVVNNNIVLIDTYNQLRGEGLSADEAALEAGGRRLRPVHRRAARSPSGRTTKPFRY